jgi:hypothetical protein
MSSQFEIYSSMLDRWRQQNFERNDVTVYAQRMPITTEKNIPSPISVDTVEGIFSFKNELPLPGCL